jgi:hypothetical protein
MKKLITLLLIIAIGTTVSSQVVLTYKDNALLAGDSVISMEIQYTSPGNAGPDQLWDFSKIQLSNNIRVSNTSEIPADYPNGFSNSNLVLNDHGYEYYLHITENSMEELGLTSKDYSFVFSDPMLKMKYPFNYSDNFTDKYSGVGSYREDRKVEVSGTYTVIADGIGTLVLPDRILKNAMRLRIDETGVQINPCNSIERKIIRYLWYVPSARYAVLGLTSSEYTATGQEPKITTSGFINEKMLNSGDLNSINHDQTASDLAEASITLYPNPFSKNFSYSYFLREQMPVSIELMDMTGRKIIDLFKSKLQSDGLHTGELDAADYNLTMGVYYLRFTFGKKVFISKVVKM